VTNQRRLGRGLEALLGRPLPVVNELGDTGADETGAASTEQRIAVGLIDRNPFQPRVDFDDVALSELCESLREHGLIQPLAVRRVGDRYQIIAGERRLRAAKLAGWTDVPVQIREADDRQLAELAIVENLQRKDLNPLEKAASFQDYLERYRCTQAQLSQRLKIDRSTIANLIRLLELPDEVQTAVRSGKISAGHARALLPLGDEHEQTSMCRRIQKEGLSVRATEEFVQQTIIVSEGQGLSVIGSEQSDAPKKRTSRQRNDQVKTLEQELRAALGTRIDIKHAARGNGKIVVHYASHEEFERLFEMLAEPARKIA
jgi:ParB family transcriptional regulator, chromosome partitioning protein